MSIRSLREKEARSTVLRLPADRWTRLFAEIAVYSFVVVLLTGAFLTFFYVPDMSQVRYDGSYERLHGATVSRAYESTLHLSLDVQGGLLMRQIHHWAALVLIAAICCLLLRMFLTGAYRRPRGGLWLSAVTSLVL
ncbi:ubiquinol-cytochrome c reductase cytochrome b subunit, partial [Actinomadura adrarensis]